MSLKSKLRLPKEHGAWGMLYIPFVLGALVAEGAMGRVTLLGVAMTFLFIARQSVLVWWRARCKGLEQAGAARTMVVYLALAAVFAVPLLVFHRLHGMIPLGLLGAGLLAWNAQQAARREERTLATELIGIAGLTLGAPATHYVALGRWEVTAAWLWAVSAVYFASSVFYVRLRVQSAHGKVPERVSAVRRQCFAYHLGLLAALLGAIRFGSLSWLLLPAYAPVLVRAFWHLARPQRKLVLKQVGYLEVAYSLVFLALAAAAFRG